MKKLYFFRLRLFARLAVSFSSHWFLSLPPRVYRRSLQAVARTSKAEHRQTLVKLNTSVDGLKEVFFVCMLCGWSSASAHEIYQIYVTFEWKLSTHGSSYLTRISSRLSSQIDKFREITNWFSHSISILTLFFFLSLVFPAKCVCSSHTQQLADFDFNFSDIVSPLPLYPLPSNGED